VKANRGREPEVAAKPPGRKGFAVTPRRWGGERTFGRLGRSRRLSKDHEQTPESEEAFARLATAQLMLRRLRPQSTD
jgi:putative transposase